MTPEFWHARWQANEIGFHRPEVHVYLPEFWPRLQTDPGDTVLVPLCGKSNDMLWLLERGQRVLGVEISPLAVEGFFHDNRLQPQVGTHGAFIRWQQDEVTLLCGDFFDLTRAECTGIRTVYDRASLIALPPEMRQRYTTHLLSLLPHGAEILLITLEYPQPQMSGPPFAVDAAEVRDLYQGRCDIEVLGRKDVLAQEPRFAARGLGNLHEVAYRLRLK